MKTSINIPEWLYEQVQRTCPGQPFGTLARDAILIALPVWAQLGPDRALEQALQAELRILSATAAAQGVTLPAGAPQARRPHRRVKPQAPAPEATPVGRKATARKSLPKTPARPNLGGPGSLSRALSRPNPKPNADSNAKPRSSTAAGARTRRAAKTPAASEAPASPAS